MFNKKEKDNSIEKQNVLTPDEELLIADAEAAIDKVRKHKEQAEERVNAAEAELREAEGGLIEELATGREPRDMAPHREKLRDAKADLKQADEGLMAARARFERVRRETLERARPRILADFEKLVRKLETALVAAAEVNEEVMSFQDEADAKLRPLQCGFPRFSWNELSGFMTALPSGLRREPGKLDSWREKINITFNPKPKRPPEGYESVRITKSLWLYSGVGPGRLDKKGRPLPEGVDGRNNPGDVVGVPAASAKELIKNGFAEKVTA